MCGLRPHHEPLPPLPGHGEHAGVADPVLPNQDVPPISRVPQISGPSGRLIEGEAGSNHSRVVQSKAGKHQGSPTPGMAKMAISNHVAPDEPESSYRYTNPA